jgi:hypothetical protein
MRISLTRASSWRGVRSHQTPDLDPLPPRAKGDSGPLERPRLTELT